jgi:hydroxyethylthiazole kinase-like uncharacterized protein yjeF
MATVTLKEMLAVETTAKSNGWTEEQLLDLAGKQLGIAIGNHFPNPGTAIAYLGKGHNAGDTLVALSILRDRFAWKIATRNAFSLEQLAPLTRKKWDEIGLENPLDHPPSPDDLDRPLILLDGLLGVGANGPLSDPLIQLANEMEVLRQTTGARVAAVDLPSGMNSNTGETALGSVIADITFAIGNAKVGLLLAQSSLQTGALAIVPVDPITCNQPSWIEAISPQTMKCGKAPRPFDFHKGMAGSVAILAGSEHFTGSAVLAATGALRAGAGLITLYVPRSIHSIISSKVPSEIIVQEIHNPRDLLNERFDCLVCGCGLGTLSETANEGFFELISESEAPAVIDADALNLIARFQRCDLLQEKHIITPHPGEFNRLAPEIAKLSRENAAKTFTEKYTATLLLKGSRTIVTRSGESLWCNTTGTPGMATGGQGDLLSGVIGACLAAGDGPMDAARLGSWLCGRSAEICLNKPGISEESLTPTDVALQLGAAYLDWKSGNR